MGVATKQSVPEHSCCDVRGLTVFFVINPVSTSVSTSMTAIAWLPIDFDRWGPAFLLPMKNLKA